jgi:hypothetical protein
VDNGGQGEYRSRMPTIYKEIKTLEELHGAVKTLDKMLEDPQPGRAAWADFYGAIMQAIADYWENSIVNQ